MAPRPALERLRTRPDPTASTDDELVSLSEAVALFMPHGLLTAATPRIAYCRGDLAGREVRWRKVTTRRDLNAMTTPRLVTKADDTRRELPTPEPACSAIARDLARRIAVARRRRRA